MIRASISGHLGDDPVERTTRNGKSMITTSAAVNVARSGEEAAAEWIGIIAFGTAGELLAQHCKGDLIEALGTLARTTFTDREGNGRTSWSLTAEAILSARTTRNQPARPRGASRSTRSRALPSGRSFYSPAHVPGLPADRVDDLYAEPVP